MAVVINEFEVTPEAPAPASSPAPPATTTIEPAMVRELQRAFEKERARAERLRAY